MRTSSQTNLLAGLLLASVTSLVGCNCDGGGTDGGLGMDGGLIPDSSDLNDSLEAYCMGAGPPIAVGDGMTTTIEDGECTGSIAEAAFRYALCTCEHVSIQDVLTTDAFDSSLGPFTMGETGGAVGVNTTYESTNVVDIGGSLTVAGMSPVTMSDFHTIRGDMFLNGNLIADAFVQVLRDGWINGNVNGELTVDRDLYQPPGASATGTIVVGGAMVNQAFSIAPPCACGPDELVDIAGIVAAGAQNNHNDSIMLDPTIFNGPTTAVDMELPCGRYYVENLSTSSAAITLRINGRTLLYVAGDVLVENPLTVETGPEGELDLFIGGNLEATDALNLGDPDRPTAVRVYIGGTQPILMSSGSVFAGYIYAPFAELRPADNVTVFGAVFARSFNNSGGVTIHYDRAILEAGADCDDPPPDMCGTCLDCNAADACIGGMCTSCVTDADCCAPLVCDATSGECVPLIL